MFYFYWTLDSNLPTCSEISLEHIDHVPIEKELDDSLKNPESYVKYTPEDCYKIGKYDSENGPAAAVRKFQIWFPKLNESTVWSFRQKYQSELTRSKQKDTMLEPGIPKEPTEQPLLLGNKIDDTIQKLSLHQAIAVKLFLDRLLQVLLKREYREILDMLDK